MLKNMFFFNLKPLDSFGDQTAATVEHFGNNISLRKGAQSVCFIHGSHTNDFVVCDITPEEIETFKREEPALTKFVNKLQFFHSQENTECAIPPSSENGKRHFRF